MATKSRTDQPESFSVNMTDVEKKMVNKLKSHYKFKTDRELLIALVKRASLSLPPTRKRG